MVKVPLVVSTAPERIWLQVADDSYSATEAFPDDHAEITWCQDSVIATEVKYVRADLHEAIAERCKRLEAAADKALRAMESIWRLKGRDDDYIYDEMGSELSGAYFWLRDAAKVET